MALRRVRLDTAPGVVVTDLTKAFAAIRDEFDVPGAFADDVLAEADLAVDRSVDLHRDETAVPFLTIDPPGSMDLDQAMALERQGSGYRVRYAIADVPAFVRSGGAIDAEARARVQTIYLPDGRSPLHPPRLSEDAASLLPGQVRPAFVWDLSLDESGELTSTQVYRAMVRSTRRLDYETVQADIDAGRAAPDVCLLAEIGARRELLELARGGSSLPMPEQNVQVTPQGYTLRFRPPVHAEGWNAQISLLTGMAAAQLMMQARVGILRTMPAPTPEAVQRLRRQAAALGVAWPVDQTYGPFLAGLDRDDPRHLAVIHEATTLFRGAGYTAFDGDLPQDCLHAAVAAPYAHVTAPLRRLVDRFGLALCAAVSAGDPVPDWVRAALPDLPNMMTGGARRAAAVERACTDAVEAAELSARVGEVFDAVVVDSRADKGVVVQIAEPAVLAACAVNAEPGTWLRLRLVQADVAARTVRFEPVA